MTDSKTTPLSGHEVTTCSFGGGYKAERHYVEIVCDSEADAFLIANYLRDIRDATFWRRLKWLIKR